MVTCESCGGTFKEDLPKCPYCGTLNAVGAEKEYNEKLEAIRTNLDNVDELAENSFKAEVATFLKVFVITVIIVGLIGLFSFGTSTVVVTTDHALLRKTTTEKLARVKDVHEKLATMDKLFDEGKYDELVEAASGYSVTYSGEIYEWKHYQFCNTYKQIIEAKSNLEAYRSEERHPSYRYVNLVYQPMYARYLTTSSGYANKYSGDDAEILAKKIDEVQAEVLELLDISEKDYEALRMKVTGGGYPQRYDVESFCEERWGE